MGIQLFNEMKVDEMCKIMAGLHQYVQFICSEQHLTLPNDEVFEKGTMFQLKNLIHRTSVPHIYQRRNDTPYFAEVGKSSTEIISPVVKYILFYYASTLIKTYQDLTQCTSSMTSLSLYTGDSSILRYTRLHTIHSGLINTS